MMCDVYTFEAHSDARLQHLYIHFLQTYGQQAGFPRKLITNVGPLVCNLASRGLS